MKTYLVSYTTNYGTGAMVVNADSDKDAIAEAIQCGAWDNAYAQEVDLAQRGVVAETLPT